MAALEEVFLRECESLEAMPLPVGSAARVRLLDVSSTPIVCLPEGMHALEDVDVSGCRRLADCWLPASSAARLHTLDAADSNMSAVPAGTTELRKLSRPGSRCAKGSIPHSVFCLLEKLDGWPIAKA